MRIRAVLPLAIAIGLAVGSAFAAEPETVAIVADGAVAETWLGRDAMRLDAGSDASGRVVFLQDVAFETGVIDLEITGEVAPGANATVRGFVGLAWAVATPERYEAFYIRATNGRSDDQVRRNRAVQYISEPEFPWERLRAEQTGAYETYADVGVGEWTRLRIEVDPTRARLFVNGAAQPTLTVPRLLNDEDGEGLALWVGPGSIGRFRDLKITRE